MPAVTSWPGLPNAVVATEPNATLDRAQDLGNLTATAPLQAVGTIGDSPAGAANVDWFSFTLAGPEKVRLSTLDRGIPGGLPAVLSLYNSDAFDFADPYDPLGHRLLAQSSGAPDADAQIEQQLGAGTYYVAVSGMGNRYFNPFLTDSGYSGSTGDYGLLITATDLGLDPAAGPMLLSADPAPGATLNRSPFLLRLDLTGNLDPGTVNLGQNVRLTLNPHGTFGDSNDQDVPLASFNFSSAANELQLFPAAPLSPGYYQMFLGGDNSSNSPALADLNGVSLGQDASNPSGQDMTFSFQVTSIEAKTRPTTGGDDVPSTAHDLGDITNAGLVQVAGALGTDPTDPVPFNPSDVDLYHFRITDTGRYAFRSEVFAGRIGSPLDPGLSLFQASPVDHKLHLIGGNDGSRNGTKTDNGAFVPLYTDPVLGAGLTAGDYYLAVSSHGNVPDPALGLLPGLNGIFDPNVPQSGTSGTTTGDYVLNVLVQPNNDPPQVAGVVPLPDSILTAPPTGLTVQFSEPVNLRELNFRTSEQPTAKTVSPVFIQGSDGTKYFPRFESYDDSTNNATFLMLDGLPNGAYELHLSGALGLTDFAGNPLVGNSLSGDYLTSFTVNGPGRGTQGNPLLWTHSGNGQVQDLGVLFPHEFQAGVTIAKAASQASQGAVHEKTDAYDFQVLQNLDYIFSLHGANLPAGVQFQVFDAKGNPVPATPQGDGSGLLVPLAVGEYRVVVSGWSPGQGAGVAYHIHIALGTAPDFPAALTAGPAPALRLRIIDVSPPVSLAAAPPRIVVPGTSPGDAQSAAIATGATSQGSSSVAQGSSSVAQGSSSVAQGSSSVTQAPSSVAAGLITVNIALVAPSPTASASESPGTASSPTFPSGALLALNAGPVGGVKGVPIADSPVATDRVLVRGPDAPATESLLRMTILTQASGYSGDAKLSPEALAKSEKPDLPAMPRLFGKSAREVGQSLKGVLDVLHGLMNWLEKLPNDPFDLEIPAETGAVFDESQVQAGPPCSANAVAVALEQRSASEWEWVDVCAVLGTAVALVPGRHQSRKKAWRVI